MTLPAVGTQAPEFELETDSGETIRLSDFRGKRVVLFFYPAADTPGCTVESCAFRDDYQRYQEQDIVILGISPDTVRAQANFSRRYGFQYPLLADAEHQVAEAYGVWQPKKLFGRDYMGVLRTTFIIDEAGKISQVYEKVDPEVHSAEVLELLASGAED